MADIDYYLGLMSGTSLDGLDIALCSFTPHFQLHQASGYPLPAELRERILDFCSDQPQKIDDLMILERDIAHFCGEAVQQFLASIGLSSTIRAIGFHGQTLRHRPDERVTLQAGNASLLAELTGIDVIADFRSRDLCAGGQGAPLVPAFHRALAASHSSAVAFVNLGGIANLTLITPQQVIGFDTGPANMLLDLWIQRNLGVNYDAAGNWAARGTPIPELLDKLLEEPYFRLKPPKSTGRELFNADWLDSKLCQFSPCSPVDVQATLLELTAVSITQGIQQLPAQPTTLYLCGGGTHNQTLRNRLGQLLPGIRLSDTSELNLHPDWVEAAAFAWLAHAFITRQPANLPSVTGANGSRILGALYPK